jgi:hypothetical protein
MSATPISTKTSLESPCRLVSCEELAAFRSLMGGSALAFQGREARSCQLSHSELCGRAIPAHHVPADIALDDD